jgi:perosamine synthetase
MIPITGPWITQKEIDYVTDAVQNGWYENAAGYIVKFEKAFAQYMGKKYALALPSCTSAIHLALLACGVKAGDDVLVPDITWTATAEPIIYIGANPIFVDVSADTWCVSRETLERAITPKTKAMFVVGLYGNMPNMDEIVAFAREKNIYLIEDSAEALGSEYKGKKAGSFGHVGVFSFHGTKTMTTGEGGMLVTDDEAIYKRASFLADHGRDKTDRNFWFVEIGYKYKMSNIQAALGLAQLERLDELLKAKRNIYRWYHDSLGHVDGLMLNEENSLVNNSFWMTSIVWDKQYKITKLELIEELKKRGVASRPFFSPLSAMPAYSGFSSAQRAKQENSVAYRYLDVGINLPSGVLLTKSDVEFVSKAIIDVFDTLKFQKKVVYEAHHRNACL